MTYRKAGDYFVPNLEVPESPKIGKYGMLRRNYLRENRQGTYTGLLLSGKLNKHLEEVDQTNYEFVKRRITETAKYFSVRV